MNKQISDYLILKSNKDIFFKVPHPDVLKTENLNEQENSLFNELSQLNFNYEMEVVLFKTIDGRIGVIGEEFTSWYPSRTPLLSIKLLNSNKIDSIHLLNMKPAKGGGFCTITIQTAQTGSKELIFFYFSGSDRNWDFNFRKTDKLLKDISQFFNCDEIKLTEAYNA